MAVKPIDEAISDMMAFAGSLSDAKKTCRCWVMTGFFGEKWGKNSIECFDDISVWYDGLNLFCCRGGMSKRKLLEILCHRVGYIDQYFFYPY